MQKYYNMKRKLNKLKASLLLLMMAAFAIPAQAQTRANEIRMKTGSESLSDNVVYNFYDTGGPYIMSPEQDPENNYNWVTWYQHDESYLLHLINPFAGSTTTKGVKIIFNYLLINNDHLKIYEGDLEDPSKLIADLTCNDYSTNNFAGYTVMSHGNMTLRFESDYHWRDAGWDALVELWDYAPQPPVANMEACDSYVELLSGSKGTSNTNMYYTTDGNDPAFGDPLGPTTYEYTAPFEITVAPTVVKTITVENGTATSAVGTYTFNRLITPPGAPTITHVAGTNTVIITAPAVPSDINDTYYVKYSLDGSDPRYSTNDVVKADTIELTQPCTVKAVTHGTTCPNIFSTEVSETISTIYVPTPEITVTGVYDEDENPDGLGNGQITCSLAGATIYYTLDGTTPTVSSPNSGTSPITLSDVPAGTTVKAMAHMDGEGYENSNIATFVYIPTNAQGEQTSGVFGSVVLLDDREPHSWSYYSDGDQPVHSLKPADVKITYFGYGDNTMTTTNTNDSGLGELDFDGDVASTAVAVGPNEAGNQFVYLKTLEAANEDGTGNYPYTLIPNPFSKRPAASQGSVTPTVTTYNRVTTITAGRKYLIVSATSGNAFALGHSGATIASDAVTISGTGNNAYIAASYVDATSVWTAGNNNTFQNGDYYVSQTGANNNKSLAISTTSQNWTWSGTNNRLSFQVGNGNNRYTWYLRYNDGFGLTTTATSVYLFEETTTGGEITGGDYRGFYAWRVKRLSSGLSIKDGEATLGVGSIINAEKEIKFVATANSTDNEVEFEALWAQAYVVTSNTATGLHAGVSYERNFVVGAAPGTTELSVPVTYSSYYPDGTGGSTTNYDLGNFTCLTDTKFEYMRLNGSGTTTANGHSLCFGRGITGGNNVQGISGDYDGDLKYTMRVESGTFGTLAYVAEIDCNVTGRVQVKAIMGCDYDRARKNNSLLSVSNQGNLFFTRDVGFTNQSNKDQKVFDLVVKSGEYQRGYWNTDENPNGTTGQTGFNYVHSMYCGANFGNSNHATHFPGARYVTIEGGAIGNINGGRGTSAAGNNNNPDATTNQTDAWKIAFSLRIKKDAIINGCVFGGAANTSAWGSKRIVMTGGKVYSWIAGGANGTNTTSGDSRTRGTSYIYVGGNAEVGGANAKMKNSTLGGQVFGAGRGFQNQAASMDTSYVVIADAAKIMKKNNDASGNVYGGGNIGYIHKASNVYILGGTIEGSVFGGAYGNALNIPRSNVTVKDGTVSGSVYGGSNSTGIVQNDSIYMSGGTVTNVYGGGLGSSTRISGNAEVNIINGTINNNVYGGGELGTVTGNTEVAVSGGTMKNIFGAGKGGSTTANIGGTTTVTVSGGTIAESVYGGGENGNVKQADNPAKGDPESPRDIPAVSTVNIEGGSIAYNVFGGGRMGFTNGGTVVNMIGGTVEGSVFGGAFGTNGTVYVAGQRTVNMRGGTVNKHIYGGSRNADDALTFNPGAFGTSTETRTASVVNMSGGYVHYQVFASGYFGNVYGSTYAFIGTNAILNAPNHVAPYGDYNASYYNHHYALRIGGSVWAGGDFGNYDGTKFGDPTITGYSHVYIDGDGYDTESNNTTNTNYMYIGGSIYGSGTSCDAGKQGRDIILRNYGQIINASQPTTAKPYSSATRALYSIQRANNLTIDNSHVVLLGEGKINSLVTTEKYTIHEFQLVRLTNGSSIFLNFPADQIKKFGSYTCPNVYADTPEYTPVPYNGLGENAGPTDNKILVNDGAYIQIKYTNADNTEEYGELEGYAHMMSDNTNNTCAYARPKQSKDEGNQIDPSYDNPLDGGFISYDASLNTFDLGTLTDNEFASVSDAPGTVEEGVQMPYENHTLVTKNGEQYFRIWRAGGQKSYREGVFVAQGDGDATHYGTVDVVVSLPAFENGDCETGTPFYRIQSFDGNTTIAQGTDVMLVNGACYDDVYDEDWMYIDGSNANANFVTGVDTTDATLKANGLRYLKENPNVNFGLIAIPSGGLEGNANMLICEASDPKIATMQWTNTHNEIMPKVTFRLTYNKNLTNNVVWDPMTITFEQVSCDGQTVLSTVDVALTVTTLTTIDQPFKTQAYAIVRGTGTATDSYTAKVVLPQYVMHVNTVGEISKWTCKQVTFVPEPGFADTLFKGGQSYLNPSPNVHNECNNKFGMTLVAGLNFDNTTGWESWETVPKDMHGWNNPNYVFGETTARDPIGFDFKLLYDGRQRAEGNYKVGTLEFTMHFTNYEGAESGTPAYEKDLTVEIEVWFLGQGNNYYIDGVNGNNLYSGQYPNAAKKTLSGIFNRTKYVAGDNIFIVDAVTADGNNKLTWNGKSYSEVTLYRYPGGHRLVPNEQNAESHWEGYIESHPDNASYRGPLVVVEKAMDMTGIVLNGFYEEAKKPEGEAIGDIEGYYHTYNSNPLPNAPLVQIKNGGNLSVYGNSRLEFNYNSETDGGGVYIEDGGVLNLYNGSAVDTNYVASGKNGGGIYVNNTSLVQLSDEVYVTGNCKGLPSAKADGSVENNVYLSTYDSHVNVGTAETDDAYTKLLPESRIGITKNHEWGDYWYAPVAYSDGGQAYLSNTLTENAPEDAAIMWDDESKYEILSLNSTHLNPPTDYVYFVGTWVTAVTSEPEGYSSSAIDTPEELAWAISVASGYNDQTAAPATEFTLTGDIDMNANIWVPIGSNGNAYTGTFNGNGHVVTGLRSPLNQQHMGMFGITNGAHISDLVAQSNFSGGTMQNVGTVIGTMNDGTLSNVEASGTLTGSDMTENMGGLVGKVNGDATIHSTFAVNTLTGGTNTVVGGLVGTNSGDLYNSYSNVTLGANNTATKMAGLVGVNTGTVENCYVVLPTGFDKPAFVHTNQVTVEDQTTKGNVNYCYAADGTTSYVGSDASGNLNGHGTFGAVKGRKAIGYLYDDNAVTAKTADTTYVRSKLTYNGKQIATWPSLVSTLNQWVAAKSTTSLTYTPWFRPTSGDINGDLPVLGFPKDNSMGTVDGKFLRYGSNVNLNGIDALLTNFNDNGEGEAEPAANLFLYGVAENVTKVPTEDVNVFINEDAILLQADGADDFINATVGITFDNSSKQAVATNSGATLEYDWHFMSSPLQDAPINATFGDPQGFMNAVNITGMDDECYFPNGLIGQTNVKWDFYAYSEKQYHWINLKRNDHFYQHNGDTLQYTNETEFVPGKGYMMAISEDSYMSSTGKLNKGGEKIHVTTQEPLDTIYNKGWNLVGNPYQAYLNLGAIGGSFYIFDADQKCYAPVTDGQSENPCIPSLYIHPHQAFFMHTDSNTDFEFDYDWATATKQNGSYYRGREDQVNYPLVNLFAENEGGSRDLAVIELNRPELGGATKVQAMRNANFQIAASLQGKRYGILFTPENTEKVPVHFTTEEDGTFTLTWDTHNGDFTSLFLVDNMTGAITDMLHSDHYTFDATTSDYASRFYLTYACTGVEEVNEGDGSFAFFDGSEWVVNGKGQLDIIDVTGRVLFSKRIANEQNRVNLNNVAPGVYMMRVSDGKDTMVQKIVVR